MGVIVTGHNSPNGFQNSEAVTVANLNSHVNSATFDSTAVDDSSIELTNTNTKLQLKNSTSTTTGTTLAKLQYIGTNKILGRTSANDGIVEQLTLDTDLSTVSASNNELATSKAIKDLVNGMRPKYVRASGGTHALNQTNIANGGTKVYTMSEFTATGNPSDFATSKITAILVQAFVKCSGTANEVLATLVSGQQIRITRAGGTQLNETSNAMFIPVESGQSTFTIQYNSGDTSQDLYTESKILGYLYQPSL